MNQSPLAPWGTQVTVTLIASLVVGFLAGTVLSLLPFAILLCLATLILAFVAWFAGMSFLQILTLSVCSFALAQIGYALGLAWIATITCRRRA